jgi:hypothetical protein
MFKAFPTVSSEAEVATLRGDDSLMLIGVFGGAKHKPEMTMFKNVARGFPFPSAMSSSADLAALYGVKAPALVVLRSEEDFGAPAMLNMTLKYKKGAAVKEFINGASEAIMYEYTVENSEALLNSPIKTSLWAFAKSKKDESWASLKTALMPVAASQKGKINIILVDGSQHKNLMEFFGFKTSQLPRALIINLHPKHGQQNFEFDGEQTEAGFQKFTDDFNAGAVSRFMRSEPLPTGQESLPVQEIVGLNFNEVVFSGRDVLVHAYSSRCDHDSCEEHTKQFTELGEKLQGAVADKESNKPLLVRLDWSHNEIDFNGWHEPRADREPAFFFFSAEHKVVSSD